MDCSPESFLKIRSQMPSEEALFFSSHFRKSRGDLKLKVLIILLTTAIKGDCGPDTTPNTSNVVGPVPPSTGNTSPIHAARIFFGSLAGRRQYDADVHPTAAVAWSAALSCA